MQPTNWQEWIAWAGLVIPLIGMAWAAIFYTLTKRREVHFQEFQRLFEIMDHLGRSGGSIASKMAAAYELRKYPQYKDVIIRMCRQTETVGPSGKMLKDEMLLTADFLEGKK
ncbi:MAG: hypothetical protein V7676_04215 [Parasphingorhabdus sp.]|uniref:hypothetical protein n=1 Tax=Parasphingorhabdus sp. TaxID=2709688 RepID=UPI00300195A6